MTIALFVVMILITLAGLAYPLFGAAAAPALAAAGGRPCVACGHALEGDEAFCPRCGAPVGRRCPSCGRSLDPDDAYCPGCGRKAAEG